MDAGFDVLQLTGSPPEDETNGWGTPPAPSVHFTPGADSTSCPAAGAMRTTTKRRRFAAKIKVRGLKVRGHATEATTVYTVRSSGLPVRLV